MSTAKAEASTASGVAYEVVQAANGRTQILAYESNDRLSRPRETVVTIRGTDLDSNRTKMDLHQAFLDTADSATATTRAGTASTA